MMDFRSPTQDIGNSMRSLVGQQGLRQNHMKPFEPQMPQMVGSFQGGYGLQNFRTGPGYNPYRVGTTNPFLRPPGMGGGRPEFAGPPPRQVAPPQMGIKPPTRVSIPPRQIEDTLGIPRDFKNQPGVIDLNRWLGNTAGAGPVSTAQWKGRPENPLYGGRGLMTIDGWLQHKQSGRQIPGLA